MSTPYVGEIRMFAGSFAPSGWAFCDGSLVSVADNPTLFTLIGTTYGGDGQTTFGLPDLRSRAPVHVGAVSGSGYTVQLGQAAGEEQVTLTIPQLPTHTHVPQASDQDATATSPAGAVWSTWDDEPYSATAPATAMSTGAVGLVGGGQSHDNMPPFVAISFIISLTGVYPSQS